jgi:signal transduction histidine kinase
MLPRDRRTLDAIVLLCVLALERLVAERQFRDRSLRVLKAEEVERRRISRRLHDDPAQSLALVRLQLEMIESALPESVRPQVMEVRGYIEKTIEVVRGLISDLSPVALEKLGIEAAIRQLVTRFKQSYPAQVTLALDVLSPVNHQISLVLYRALQECFTNISRHSGAKNINVSLTTADKVLRLHVEDDGIGFQVKDGLSRQDCFGLVGIRERITLLGGYLSVRSTPDSGGKAARRSRGGTEIYVELPLSAENPS